MRVLETTASIMLIIGFAAGTSVHAADKVHQLGPTGIFESLSGMTIKVTTVAKRSPAYGKIKPGDVILGAGGVAFKQHVRRELADAIDQAETEEAKGILVLTLRGPRVRLKGPAVPDLTLKDGAGIPDDKLAAPDKRAKSHTVELQLKVLGTYSDTAPYNCPKSEAILKAANLRSRNGRFRLAKLAGIAIHGKPEVKARRDAAGQPKQT